MIYMASEIVGDKKIKFAIVIVIYKGGRCGPTGIANPGFLGNVRKRPVPVVLQQMIGTQTRNVNIVEAVIIIIPNGYPHTPSDIADAGLFGYIRKRAVTIIVIESALGFFL